MSIVALDIIACIIGIFVVYQIYARRTSYFPPGPPGLPLLGNTRDIPASNAWLKYVEWSHQYRSDIIRLKIFGTNLLVVNSLEAATDLFERRSSIYNDRPHLTMIVDLVGLDWSVTLARYGEQWRDMRRMFHQAFNHDVVDQYQYIQIQACHELLRRLATQPEHFIQDIRHMTGRVIMMATYGIEVESDNDRYISIVERGTDTFSAILTGSYLVDSIPYLKYLPEWFPGATFQKQAKIWKPIMDALVNEPYRHVQTSLANGDIHKSAVLSLLESIPTSGKDMKYMEDTMKGTLGTIYAAGADTTVSSLVSFFLAMVLYPEVQKKAQEDIDKAIGSDRLPDFSDREALPFIAAILNEVLRWHPVVPLNVPHRLIQDDVYNGYFLPKGTLVVANNWAILHDEKAYPDPLTFNPDRFMKDGKLSPDIRDPNTAAFGFGRRKCPGEPMAKNSLWISITSILASFIIEPKKDPNGLPIIPTEEYIGGLLCHPKPFVCSIRPRSAKYGELVAATSIEEH